MTNLKRNTASSMSFDSVRYVYKVQRAKILFRRTASYSILGHICYKRLKLFDARGTNSIARNAISICYQTSYGPTDLAQVAGLDRIDQLKRV